MDMNWSAGAIFLLVIFVGLLADCVSFLVFGWRLPGTFRRPAGARLKAWADVSLSVACIVTVLLFADNFDSGNSPAKNRLLPWFEAPQFILIGFALVS
jgi:hypothetical protein